MNHIYSTYLCMIRNSYSTIKEPVYIPPEAVNTLVSLGQRQFTSPFLFPYLKTYPEAASILKKQSKMNMYQYYQIEHFTELIDDLMTESGIPYILLKGISLAAYYPLPEYRKLGDIDLYISDPAALCTAKAVLEAHGFVPDPDISDHHLAYFYTFPKTGRTYTLELHFRVVGLYQYEKANQIVDQVFSADAITEEQTIHNHTYSVLAPTEYTFYMLHHMLKHYLYSGFGIRLLFDFTLYLMNRSSQIHFDLLHKWCADSHIIHFYEIVVESCRTYLGLSASIDSDIHYDNTRNLETFFEKILGENDMGTSSHTALVGSGSYKKITLWTYFKEGHLQMKVRFPRLHKCFVLWPVLWVITFICFIWNTYHYRHTTFKDTLADFKKTNADSQLIRIFENSD